MHTPHPLFIMLYILSSCHAIQKEEEEKKKKNKYTFVNFTNK